MELKIYKANQELANLIISKGWIEIHSLNSDWYKKGKRIFRKSNSSKSEIVFDYDTILFNYRDNENLLCINDIYENDLDSFINYCNNYTLRTKIAKEFGEIKHISDIEKIKNTLNERIRFYDRVNSNKRKIISWKNTIRAINYRN